MDEPVAQSRRPPPGPPGPPAPPTTGDPGGGGVDPRDPGPAIGVQIGDVPLGDLGHPRVDARLLAAIVLRGGEMARWLARRGVAASAVAGLPDSAWPLNPPRSWMHQPANPSDPDAPVPVRLGRVDLGDLGEADADARLLTAIALRGSAVSTWLAARGIAAADVEREVPSASWDRQSPET